MRLRWSTGSQREHGLLVIGVKKRLSIARIEQNEVLLKELAHNFRTTHIAQERGFGRGQIWVLDNVETDLGRQILAIL